VPPDQFAKLLDEALDAQDAVAMADDRGSMQDIARAAAALEVAKAKVLAAFEAERLRWPKGQM
jgi:hypothetical protein